MKKIIKYIKKHPGCNGEDIVNALGAKAEQKIIVLVKEKVIIPSITGGPTFEKPYNYLGLYLSNSKIKTKQTFWQPLISSIINFIKFFLIKIFD